MLHRQSEACELATSTLTRRNSGTGRVGAHEKAAGGDPAAFSFAGSCIRRSKRAMTDNAEPPARAECTRSRLVARRRADGHPYLPEPAQRKRGDRVRLPLCVHSVALRKRRFLSGRRSRGNLVAAHLCAASRRPAAPVDQYPVDGEFRQCAGVPFRRGTLLPVVRHRIHCRRRRPLCRSAERFSAFDRGVGRRFGDDGGNATLCFRARRTAGRRARPA